jgi:hypothetical protein
MWNEAQIEALIDRRVIARLATDRDYLFAENADEQALAERKIELQEELQCMRTLGHHPEARVRAAEIEPELLDVIAQLRGGVEPGDKRESFGSLYGRSADLREID